MAMLKVFSQKWAASSSSAGGCLSWCFGTGQPPPDRREYLDPNGDGGRTDSPPPPYTNNGDVPVSYTNGGVALGEEALTQHGAVEEEEDDSYTVSKSNFKDSPGKDSRRSSALSEKCSGKGKGSPTSERLSRDTEKRRSLAASSKGKDVPDGETPQHRGKTKRSSSRGSDHSAKGQDSKRKDTRASDSPDTEHRSGTRTRDAAATERAGKERDSQRSSKSSGHVREVGDLARPGSRGSSTAASTPNTSNTPIVSGSDAITITDGSAYAYDDAETSSDSDDEVLRRYQQTMGMQRAPSKQSIRSAKSTKSTTSRASRSSKTSKTSKKSKAGTVNPSSPTVTTFMLDGAPTSTPYISIPSSSAEEKESVKLGKSALNNYDDDPDETFDDSVHDSVSPEAVVKSTSETTSAPGPTPDQDELISLAEQGQGPQPTEVHSVVHGEVHSVVHSDPELSGPEDGSETDPIIPPSGRGSGAGSAASSAIKPASFTLGQDESEQLVAGTSTTHEYQNDAYTEEASPSGDVERISEHHSENHSAGFNDTASMSIGDVDQDEHLFDVSDLQDREQPIISKCGNLEVSFSYSYERSRMSITVHRALEIPSKDRGGANNSQIRLLLLPTKKVRNKTKIRPGENPEFNETFSIKVPPEEINNMGVRFRLYGCERMRRERMIGESVVGFASLNQDEETTHMLTLEPRSNLSRGDSNLDVASLSRSDSASSTQSMQHGGMPELLVGLAYNGTTGRLCVEVIKGSNFRNMAMNRAPDTYVKLTLMSPTGQEIARSKTSIRRGQPNPLYKETFMFQVALFQLPEVTLMTSVYNKRSMKRKEMIGWFSLGKNNSGEEELAHWNDMRESKGEQVCRWHVLLES